MTATTLLTFAAGVVSHKLWRVAWYRRGVRLRRRGLMRELRAEFAPPKPADAGPRRRFPHVTEVG